MSQDKNNNQFILSFKNDGEQVALDDTYTVEVLTKFAKSGASRLTTAKVRQNYATWEFDTDYITQDEGALNYVYVRKSGNLVVSADANCFVFNVGLSEIDKDAGRVAEVYDENYQKHLDEFKENVNFEEIAQAEQDRKEAETLREESYEQKVDAALVEADVVEKVDNKVTELTPRLNELTAQLAQKVGSGKKAELEDLSPTVISAIEGGEGTSFDLLTIPQDGSVTPVKTTFFNLSSNIFNASQVTDGATVELTGEITANNSYWLSDFIKVSPSENLSITSQSAGGYRVAYYTASKDFLARGGAGNSLLSVPADDAVAYIRLSTTYTVIRPESVMLNRGADLLPFEAYDIKMKSEYLPEKETSIVTPSDTSFFNFSENLFDYENIENQKTVETNGTINVNPSYWLSDFVPVVGGDKLSITTSDIGGYRVALYNEVKEFISRTGVATGVGLITIPPSVAYIRLSTTYTVIDPETVMLNRGEVLKPFQDFGQAKIKSNYLPDIDVGAGVDFDEIEDFIYSNLPSKKPSFPTLTFETVTTGHSYPLWMSSDGDVLYGCQGYMLQQSTDEWQTTTLIGTTEAYLSESTVLAVRELPDGEILFSTVRYENQNIKAKLYKTVGYDRNNPSVTTFKEVLESQSPRANFNNSWGISVYENIVVASEYGVRGPDGNRYVYLSNDFGETWEVIFDLYTEEVEGRPALTDTAHTHTVAYDPYFNRIWLAVGDNPNTATYYSDDMGASWTMVEGSEVVQYTGIIALPDCVIFGSDRAPNGLHIYRRKDKATPPKIKPFYVLNDRTDLTHVFALPYKRDWHPDTPTYFSAPPADGSDGKSVIMGFVDGNKAYVLWEATNNSYVWHSVGPTSQGNIVTYMSDDTVSGYRIVKAKAPDWI